MADRKKKPKAKEPAKVHRISPALSGLLVPIESLHRHPENPNRGDVEAIMESLERFGQVRPVLATPDGTIVAGNHTFEAAVRLGWEDVAAVLHDFPEEEADAYLAADNGIADLSRFDEPALAALLKRLDKGRGLAGTGYRKPDLEKLLKRVAPPAPEEFPAVDPGTATQTCPRCGYELD